MVLFIEGPDNSGKGTQIDLIKKYVEYKYNCPVHYLHYSNIKGKQNKEEIRELSEQLYRQMFQLLKADSIFNNDLIICDRSHLGEAVYSPMYRKYSGDYVFDLEKEYLPEFEDPVGLLVFTETAENLIKRDDGLSFSIDPVQKQAEIDTFRSAFNKSKVPYKKFIELQGRGPDTIFEEEVLPILEEMFEDQGKDHDC